MVVKKPEESGEGFRREMRKGSTREEKKGRTTSGKNQSVKKTGLVILPEETPDS